MIDSYILQVTVSFCIQKTLLFQIRVWKVQEDIRTATDHTVLKVMEASIDGLQKHTVYVLRVLGYSGGGDGALSESIYFTVLGKFST